MQGVNISVTGPGSEAVPLLLQNVTETMAVIDTVFHFGS